jgi:hypothetical protein
MAKTRAKIQKDYRERRRAARARMANDADALEKLGLLPFEKSDDAAAIKEAESQLLKLALQLQLENIQLRRTVHILSVTRGNASDFSEV